MINPPTGVAERCLDVLFLQVWHFFQDLLVGTSSGKQIQYVNDTNSHPTDTGTPATLIGIDRDSLTPVHILETLVPIQEHP